MLKLKLQYFGYLMQRANSLEKSHAGKKWEEEEEKKKAGEEGLTEMRWLDGIMGSMEMSLSKFWEIVKEREAYHAVVHGVAKSWTQLSDRTKQHKS